MDDGAARRFALRLYAGLLGMRLAPGQRSRYVASEPERMYVAMREARLEIFRGSGLHTWGAYQHYGDPNGRLFDARTLRRSHKK